MGKSLDFVKKEVDLKKNCFEFGTDKVLDYLFYKEKCGENLWSLEFTRPDTREKFEVKIKYDPETDGVETGVFAMGHSHITLNCLKEI